MQNHTITLQEAILQRHSVRSYSQRPIPAHVVASLRQAVLKANAESGLHIQLVTDEPKAFRGRMAYGVFHGVSNYLAMVGPAAPDLEQRIGYYGERLVLTAKQLGLDSCWVGLTYNNVPGAFQVFPGEKRCCLVALGYGSAPGRNVKHKSVEQVSNASASTPDWFRQAVQSALLAPTAVNQQKFRFLYLGLNADGLPRVKAQRTFSLMGYTRMDLGIVRLHFEIGAGDNKFVWED